MKPKNPKRWIKHEDIAEAVISLHRRQQRASPATS
jgi:hypothetical protein